ncbi:MAG: heat shock protein HspQ [Gammaproteobacteria bacterium]|nr:heat shock protein HspQ [Gammaproteobacteria bacterium]MYK84335.1 heat shock protein HspQ [Gammaproteobacteria bacterium]
MTQFAPGEIVKHRKFGYRGVIFQADTEFELSEEWYEAVARSRPPKDAPWYHVLVDGGSHSTYVAERHLARSGDRSQIEHPMLGHYFESYNGRSYLPHTVH